jgi:hypothetical protein
MSEQPDEVETPNDDADLGAIEYVKVEGDYAYAQQSEEPGDPAFIPWEPYTYLVIKTSKGKLRLLVGDHRQSLVALRTVIDKALRIEEATAKITWE